MTTINKVIASLRAGNLVLITAEGKAILVGSNSEKTWTRMSMVLPERPNVLPAILVSSITMVEGCIHDISDGAYQLMEVIEDPIELLFPDARNIPTTLSEKDGHTLFRFVKNGFLHSLVERMRQPIISVDLEGKYSVSTESKTDFEIDLITIHEAIPSRPDTTIQFNADDTFKLLRGA